VVFHRRRSSHLFYTPYVFSQCQTRVKLNHSYTSPSPAAFAPRGATPERFTLQGLRAQAPFQVGLACTLSGEVPLSTDTFPRVTTASGEARHGITMRSRDLVGSPVPGCLAGCDLQLHTTRLVITFDPIKLLGSSFPADSAKPVPLAVVSLDSR
jgi:hypothetical protein